MHAHVISVQPVMFSAAVMPNVQLMLSTSGQIIVGVLKLGLLSKGFAVKLVRKDSAVSKT